MMRRCFRTWNVGLAILGVVILFGCGETQQARKSSDSPTTPSEVAETPATQPTEPAADPTGSAAKSEESATGEAQTTVAPEESSSAAPAAGEWGTLMGRFVYDGTRPQPASINVTKDVEVCGKHDLVDESLLVGENGGIKNVLVWLYNKPTSIHPSYEETADAEVTLDNKHCRFDPHVCVVRTTQKLKVLNSDPVGHNTKADLFNNPAFNYIVPPGGTFEVKLDYPERRPAATGCSIHPWMSAWLVVQDQPYVAVSAADGTFEIKNLPTGKLTFNAWQEKAGYVNNVSLGGKPREWKKGRFEVTVSAGDNDLGEIKLKPDLFK